MEKIKHTYKIKDWVRLTRKMINTENKLNQRDIINKQTNINQGGEYL